MPLGSGSSVVLPVTARDLGLGDSANYYVASSPTPGTGIITGTPTTLVNTTPCLVVYNGGALTAYLIYLKLKSITAGASAFTRFFVHQIDQGNRMGTATNGTQLTINNTNIQANVKTGVQATFGAITSAAIASANMRLLGDDAFRIGLVDIVGDIYEWQFGCVSRPGVGSTPATVCHFLRSAPPVVLQPNSSYVLNVFASTFATGITFEVEMGFAEK